METAEIEKLIGQMINHFVAYWDYSEHNDGEPYPTRVDTLFARYEEMKAKLIAKYASQPAASEEEEIENADDRCPKCKSIYIMKHRYDDSYKICMSCKHNWRT